MPIPLIRSGNDETPLAWWEWLFAPVVMPLIFVTLLILAVVALPVGFVDQFRRGREEARLRTRLVGAGRFVAWQDVEVGLRTGRGTLLVEHLGPKGPIREWWTPDDLIARSSLALPASLNSRLAEGQLEPLYRYAAACAARYTDPESGAAQLTEVPVSLAERFDPRKLVVVDLGGCITAIRLVKGRKLAEKYPAARIVTLVMWLGEPLLFAGDAETVFLSAAAEGVEGDTR